MRRMSVSPAFRLALMIGAMIGAIVGMLFPMFCFGLGAFRPGYDPAILAMLYDFGYLAFIGSLGCFCVMWTALGLAILLDKNNIRSEEHTSELQSLMRISYSVFCLKKNNINQ